MINPFFVLFVFGELNYEAYEAFIRKGSNKEAGNAVRFGTTPTPSLVKRSLKLKRLVFTSEGVVVGVVRALMT